MMSKLFRRAAFTAVLIVLGYFNSASAQDLIISELMAVNNGTIEDEDGNTPDWIELFNAGNSTQNLSTRHFL